MRRTTATSVYGRRLASTRCRLLIRATSIATTRQLDAFGSEGCELRYEWDIDNDGLYDCSAVGFSFPCQTVDP